MDLPPQQSSIIDAGEEVCTEEACMRATQQLEGLLGELKEARKCLRRDWEQLAPRDRSAQIRIVKELEQQKRSLEEEIEMNREG